MTNVFGRGHKRFSIDDAFEEENDEAIKVYGSTTERSPLQPKTRSVPLEADTGDGIIVNIETPTSSKVKLNDDTLSRDSDSLIQDTGYTTGLFDPSQSCWQHPKIRENWKTVLAAIILFIIGIGLLCTGAVVVFLPGTGLQGFVFLITGAICFIPGAYHVVYIYLAVQGRQGYDFYHLPLFN